MSDHFKTCPLCARIWPSREAFLADRDIQLVGYQVNYDDLVLGLLLFNHETCKTTLAIRALQLKDLYVGPVFKDRRTGQEDCPGYCLRNSELSSCPAECECAWVRGLLQIIRRWPKTAGASAIKAAGRA
jgi:hypothetical protein